jgi:hypothetical protein
MLNGGAELVKFFFATVSAQTLLQCDIPAALEHTCRTLRRIAALRPPRGRQWTAPMHRGL